MTDKRRTAFSAALLVIVLTLSLPAAAEEGDRFEAYNRAVHGMNAAVYRTVLNPLAVYYQQNVPPPVRQGVANFFANLMEPMTVAYSLALGDTDNAGNAANRFVINTFTGLAGVRDPAGERGVKSRRVHFSEVLCLYGVPNGDYVVLPILGPSTIRQTAAGTFEFVMMLDMVGNVFVPVAGGDTLVEHFETGARQTAMIDVYAAQRDWYLRSHNATCAPGGMPHDMAQDTPHSPLPAPPRR